MDALKRKMEIAAVAFFCTVTALIAAYIDASGLKNLEYLYRSYHTLGGNGTGTELYNRAKALPIHDN